MLLVALAASFVVACKHEPKPLTDAEACDMIGALPRTKWKPADIDNCYVTYSTLGHNVRLCTDKCIRNSSNADDFEDCRDDCSGETIPSFVICQKMSNNDKRVDACRDKHNALLPDSKERYTCWSRCGRRANTGLEAEACDKTCNVPD